MVKVVRLFVSVSIVLCLFLLPPPAHAAKGGKRAANTPAPTPTAPTCISGIIPSIQGDYNGDGCVDTQDEALYRSQFGECVSPLGAASDGAADGEINDGDWIVWKKNVGRGCPPTWSESQLLDPEIRSLVSLLLQDGVIDRDEMIALFFSAGDNEIVDGAELSDLQLIASTPALFGPFDHVRKLSSYIAFGNPANAHYQGTLLGNLAAGSDAEQLEMLVAKWFLGLDRPAASGTYRPVAGTPFVDGAAYTDVRQGGGNGCFVLVALAEFAQHDPAGLANMFTINGDGTYSVRFYHSGATEYVTVDSHLPTSAVGKLLYAGKGSLYNNTSNELWVALAEKAYVQLHETGWLRPGLPNNGLNNYAAIDGGYIYAALSQVTGQSTIGVTMVTTTSFNTFVTAHNQGKMIGFSSAAIPPDSRVVPRHAYAVVGYDANTQKVTLFNPWGIEYGLLTLSWSEMQANFAYFDRTA